MQNRALFAVPVLCLLLGGCFEPFDPPSQIKDLRILSIRAEPPEALPGETVRVDALIADPSGIVTPPTLIWLLCFPDPFGGVDACATGVGASPVAFGVKELEVTIPEDIPLRPEGDPNASGTVLVTLVACTSPDPTRCLECDEETGVCTFGSEGVEAEVALKRIIVSKRPEEARNHNPRIEEVAVALPGSDTFIPVPPEGLPEPLEACDGFTVRVRAPEESQEVYEEIQLGELVTVTEFLVTSFFTTTGAVSANRIFNGAGEGVEPGVADVEFLPAPEDPLAPIQMFFVLRDDRGGADFVSRTLSLASSCGGP